MKIKNHSRLLRLWFLLIFNINQLIAIDFYWPLLMLLITDFDWMLSSGSTMYKHLCLLTVEAPVCPVMIDCSSRSARRHHFRYSPLYLTQYPILHSPLHCPTTHFRCLDFDDDDDDNNNDSGNGKFYSDRTRKKKHFKGDWKISVWPLKNCIESP